MAYNQPFNSNSFQKRTQPEEQKERKKVRIYTTEKIKDLITDLKKGYDVDMGPFFENDIELRDGNVPFKLTEEEYAKWLEYSGNAEPFIEEQVQFMTDNGRTLVKLRDYQRDYIHLVADEVYNEDLNEFVPKNRNICCMQSRQSSKCFIMTTLIQFETEISVNADRVSLVKLFYKSFFKNQFHFKNKVLKKKEVPLYELYYCNIKKNITFKDILIYKLYKLYSFLK